MTRKLETEISIYQITRNLSLRNIRSGITFILLNYVKDRISSSTLKKISKSTANQETITDKNSERVCAV